MEWVILAITIVVIGAVFLRSLQAKYNAVFSGISRIYELMGALVNDSPHDRVLILYTENNGGLPHVGTPLYSSVLYEYTNQRIRPIKRIFQRVQVDLEYADMLRNLERNKDGGILIYTDEMPPSMLRDIYQEYGVECSYIFKIRETPKKYYYGSVQSADRLTGINVGELQLFASNIKNVFRTR